MGGYGSLNAMFALLVKFFREKNALSELGAIPMEAIDWAEIGYLKLKLKIKMKIYYRLIKC